MEEVIAESEYNLKGFFALWSAQMFSLLGSSIVQFTIIWWLTIETGSSIVLSLASFVGLIPIVIFIPLAGVLSDRLNRKYIVIVTDLVQALFTMVLIWCFVLNIVELWLILLLLAIRGTMQAFQLPTGITIFSLMVPPEKLSQMNALNSIGASLIFIASPAIGALLISFVAITDILWIDVITVFPAVIVLYLVFIPNVDPNESPIEKTNPNEALSSMKKELFEGWSFIRKNDLLPLVLIATIMNILINPTFNLLPLFIIDHGGHALDFAAAQISFQLGILAGAVILMVKNFRPKAQNIMYSACFTGIGMINAAFTPQGLWWVMFTAFFVVGVSTSFIDVQLLSLLQIVVPQELQGRVFASAFMIIKSMLPIGTLIVGMVAEVTGVLAIFILSPLILLLTLLYVLKLTACIKSVDQKIVELVNYSKQQAKDVITEPII